jgi:nitrate reductase assembly molybdenum cofactor insertion protein NarJ
MRILKVIGLLLEYPDELLWENRTRRCAGASRCPLLTPLPRSC